MMIDNIDIRQAIDITLNDAYQLQPYSLSAKGIYAKSYFYTD